MSLFNLQISAYKNLIAFIITLSKIGVNFHSETLHKYLTKLDHDNSADMQTKNISAAVRVHYSNNYTYME